MSELVQCAYCKTPVPSSQADVVTFGSGYRCQRCTTGIEVVQHHHESQLSFERQQRDQTLRLIFRVAPIAILLVVGLAAALLNSCSRLLH